MAEHVHERRFGYRSDGNYNLPGASTPGFYCTHKECGYDSGTWLSLAEAEARLNATERFSALQAKELMVFGMGSTRIARKDLVDALKAYADTLEGK